MIKENKCHRYYKYYARILLQSNTKHGNGITVRYKRQKQSSTFIRIMHGFRQKAITKDKKKKKKNSTDLENIKREEHELAVIR